GGARQAQPDRPEAREVVLRLHRAHPSDELRGCRQRRARDLVAVEPPRRDVGPARRHAVFLTNASASLASSTQSAPLGPTTIHSFMTLPSLRGSNGFPAPSSTSAATRALGSLTTRSPLIVIAKILALTLRTRFPAPQPCSSVTPLFSAKAATTGAKLGGTE